MPVMDGHTAMRMISESNNPFKPYMAALTANADARTRERCLEEGFNAFLTKPMVIRDLDVVFNAAYIAKHGAVAETPIAGSPQI